jgi:hypothetical protein
LAWLESCQPTNTTMIVSYGPLLVVLLVCWHLSNQAMVHMILSLFYWLVDNFIIKQWSIWYYHCFIDCLIIKLSTNSIKQW